MESKKYTVFSLYNGHLRLPHGGYLNPPGDPNGHDRSYPVEVPEGHILWKLANANPPEVRIVEGDVPHPVAEPKAKTKAVEEVPADVVVPPEEIIPEPLSPEEIANTSVPEVEESLPEVYDEPVPELEPEPELAPVEESSSLLEGLSADAGDDEEPTPISSTPKKGRRK